MDYSDPKPLLQTSASSCLPLRSAGAKQARSSVHSGETHAGGPWRRALIPFLKWPGGKRWLTQRHPELFAREFKLYIEPFLGSGAAYFHIEPKAALLGDSNLELVKTYQAVKDDWQGVLANLRVHQESHSTEYYYAVRRLRLTASTEVAARMLYLNRTAFNGMYRVNLQGEFNVPIGSKSKVIYDNDDFGAAAKLLETAELHPVDFEQLIAQAGQGDFVFADPPYTVNHNDNGFIKYNERLFSWEDQVRLADSLARARDRGASVVLTNANHASLRSIYRERDFAIHALSRFSSISGKAESRGTFQELVATT